jgi:hypothetical protein
MTTKISNAHHVVSTLNQEELENVVETLTVLQIEEGLEWVAMEEIPTKET